MSKLTWLCLALVFPAVTCGVIYALEAKQSDAGGPFAAGLFLGLGLAISTILLARRDNRLSGTAPHPRG